MTAPVGEPLAEDILADIETTLAAIATAGSANYYTDVSQVYRADKMLDNIENLPAIVVAPGFSQLEIEGVQVSEALAVTANYDLTLVMAAGDNPARDIMRFIRDVHRALLIDRQRSGAAVDTIVMSSDPYMPEDTAVCYVLADMRIAVRYRTESAELNTAV